MGQFSFGEMLQQQRRKQGITQERLCEGLCDTATLSRIESGHQQPSRNLLVVLLQRLGVVADRYYCLNKFEELEQEERVKPYLLEIYALVVDWPWGLATKILRGWINGVHAPSLCAWLA